MTIKEAAILVLQSTLLQSDNEIFVLDMGKPIKILDLAKKMIKLSELTEKSTNNPNLKSDIVDVSNYQEVEKAVSKILKESKIDILINNAGITGPTMPLWEYDVEMWNKIVKIGNAKSPWKN